MWIGAMYRMHEMGWSGAERIGSDWIESDRTNRIGLNLVVSFWGIV